MNSQRFLDGLFGSWSYFGFTHDSNCWILIFPFHLSPFPSTLITVDYNIELMQHELDMLSFDNISCLSSTKTTVATITKVDFTTKSLASTTHHEHDYFLPDTTATQQQPYLEPISTTSANSK